ncbi:MAG: hypothetical protein LRY37_05230 [Alkalibacterium thalassium]|nr:hypothetical protein [Alkalibacterium thalassium]
MDKLDRLIIEKRKEHTSKSKDIEYVEKNIQEYEVSLTFWNNLMEAWKNSFSNEWSKNLHDFTDFADLSLADKAQKSAGSLYNNGKSGPVGFKWTFISCKERSAG